MTTKSKLAWRPQETPEPLNSALSLLSEEYPLTDTPKAELTLIFRQNDNTKGYAVTRTNHQATITYSRTCDALRAVGTLLADLVDPGSEYAEETQFTTLGIMLDCSRNAVMKVEHFKKWLRRLALMGFNMAMLYTEDTYELPGEDYFGWMRGRYTPEELRQIDDYAHRLGIEMIACIQTLGHMEHIIKWPAYKNVSDTPRILLANEPKTYQLIEKMIAHFASIYRSRRVHIGMDEAANLGKGQYLERFGPRSGIEIFNDHLKQVVKICDNHGLKPMIWSDMYFCFDANGTGKMPYIPDAVVPDQLKANLPNNVQLVYWEYAHTEEAFHEHWFKRHRELGFEPIMASAVWTWSRPWYSREITEPAAGAAIRASKTSGTKEIIFTMWGDDGAYCDFDSALAGLAYVSELAYHSHIDESVLEKRFRAICSASYAANILAGELNEILPAPGPIRCLSDDPLLAIDWHERRRSDPEFWTQAARRLQALADKLATVRQDQGAGDLSHAHLFAKILARKISLASQVRRAYAQKDKGALKQALAEVKELISLIHDLDNSFRTQWLRRNKPFGLEALQIRLAGPARRCQELADRLEELLSGKIESIPEFDEPVPR